MLDYRKGFCSSTLCYFLLASCVLLLGTSCARESKPDNGNYANNRLAERNMLDSMYHAVCSRDSLLCIDRNSAEARAIDTLTSHVANYLTDGILNKRIGSSEDQTTRFGFMCKVNPNGEITEVYVCDDNPSSINELVYTNYLLSMPRFEKWKEINPYQEEDCYTDIILSFSIRWDAEGEIASYHFFLPLSR